MFVLRINNTSPSYSWKIVIREKEDVLSSPEGHTSESHFIFHISRGHRGEQPGVCFGERQTWVKIQGPKLTDSVPLGKLLNISDLSVSIQI